MSKIESQILKYDRSLFVVGGPWVETLKRCYLQKGIQLFAPKDISIHYAMIFSIT